MSLEQLTLSDEQVQDIVASLITGGGGSDVVYDDTNDTLTVSLSDSISVNTLEADSVTFNQDITDADNNTVTNLSDPVRVTEEASTFTESGVTVTNNKTEASNNSLQLADVVLGTTADRTDDNDSTSATRRRGIQINPNTNIEGIQLTLSQNTSGATTAYLVNDSNGIDLQQISISGKSPGDTVEFRETLSSGTAYRAVADDGGNNYTAGFFDTGSLTTFFSSDIDITAGMDGGNEVAIYANFTDVTPITATDLSSGDAVVEFNSAVPEDITSYDLATFQRTLDGENVTIDVEDSNGNILASDIDRDTDISNISTSKEVRFRVNISSSNTSNNPTCDYLARRFTR